MAKPLGCYFQVQSTYYQVAQGNQKKNIPINLEFQGSVFRNLLKRAFLCLGQFKGKFYFEMP